MLFNSYVFILLFLPLCLAGYFLLNHFRCYQLAQGFLLGMSLWFYGYFNPSYLPIILISICGNFLVTKLMNQHTKFRKPLFILAIAANLGVLFYYKYYDFFISNVNRLFATDFNLLHVMLPLGISFFTFQQLSYVIDSYQGEVEDYGFLQYATYVAYFPQLIAGPIVTHDELIPQLMDPDRKQFNWDNFASGLYTFANGLAKKVLIADLFGRAVTIGYSDVCALNSTNAILVMLAYTFQVYFDFSGYCDMAMGLAKMMNMDLPVNFDSPYKALTISEFWHRWHKTLTRFFTRYIYIPLGGNRKGKYRTYLNVMIIYCVSGLWHGASWSFVFWGVMHGVCCVLDRHFKEWISRSHPVFNWILTFTFVNVAWIFFRAARLKEAAAMIRQILLCDFGPISLDLASVFHLQEIVKPIEWLIGVRIDVQSPNLMLVLCYTVTMLLILGVPNAYEKMQTFTCKMSNMITTALLFVWCIISLAGVSIFLYFNF